MTIELRDLPAIAWSAAAPRCQGPSLRVWSPGRMAVGHCIVLFAKGFLQASKTIVRHSHYAEVAQAALIRP